MPNWCNNTLELAHKDPAMLIRAKDAFNRMELLNEFIPVPKPLHIISGYIADPVEQAKLEAAPAQNKADYGYDNWYVAFDGKNLSIVWVGYEGERKTKSLGLYGATTAFNVFQNYYRDHGKRFTQFGCELTN